MHSTPTPPGSGSAKSQFAFTPGQAAGGRYILRRALGEGGMSVVWLAHDTRLQEPVALKFLPPHVAGDPAALDRLRKETLRTRKLSHPNIIRIHDFHETAGEPAFISMEYVDGQNLHYLRAARANGVLPWTYLAPLAAQLCEALHYAHGEGVIHRDLKPANLMLDSNGRLKLADFGLARVARDSQPRVSRDHVAGTLDYMSPQQVQGLSATIADDIYSFGATFYELLVSKPPFHDGDVAYQIQHNRPQPISERLLELGITNEGVPSDISALIMACLAKDPEQRPQSARAILDWLTDSQRNVSKPAEPAESQPAPTPATAIPPTPASVAVAEPVPVAEPIVDETASSTTLDLEPVPVAPAWRSRRVVIAGAAVAVALVLGIVVWVGRSYSAKKDAAAFESLFNGTDLNGWSCDSRFWSIENGAIVGSASNPDRSFPRVTFLVWRGADIADFELRLLFDCADSSGICYRARRNSENGMTGYHAEISSQGTGQLLFTQSRGDRFMGKRGERTAVWQSGNNEIVQSLGPTADASQLQKALDSKGWSEYVIIARSNRFQHWINGVLFADVTDENPSKFVRAGRLAIEFFPRASDGRSVRFKDIRLKRFPPETAASMAEAKSR
jgi:serine/threonine protein kinase